MNIQTTVTNYLAGQSINVKSFSIYAAEPATGDNLGPWNNAAARQGIAVDVQASYTPILPTAILPDPVLMHSKVIMIAETN